MLPATRRLLRFGAIWSAPVATRQGTLGQDRRRDPSAQGKEARQKCCSPATFGAPPAGLEPATRCLEGSRSIQLSYGGEQLALTCDVRRLSPHRIVARRSFSR